MSSILRAVSFDAHDPDRLARFWGTLLARDVVAETDAVLLPGEGGQVGLRFTRSVTRKTGLNQVHLHLTSASLADQQLTVATAVRLGARHVDIGQRPEEEHVVLADPEGNELCVIEPGNAYLDGCGFLGEVACEGTRTVGLFWSDVLGWPLVWDQDQETAVQAPLGGTKVAWSGTAPRPGSGGPRQRLEVALARGERESEIARLVSAGATRGRELDDGTVELTDPDGAELTFTSAPP